MSRQILSIYHSANFLALLEEMTVQVNYKQGTADPLRQKRYVSEGVNHADWGASFVANIPFNENGTEVMFLNVFGMNKSFNSYHAEYFVYVLRHLTCRISVISIVCPN